MKIRNLLGWLVVIFFVVTSGSVRFYVESPAIWISIYAFLSFMLFFVNRKKLCNNSWNTIVLLIFAGWLFVNTMFIHSDNRSNLGLSAVLFAIGSFFAISAFEIDDFKRKLLKVLRVLCIISIIVQILHDYFGLSPDGIDERGSFVTLYLFNCNWGEKRLSSIYWEPGQFQIVLIYTFCLFYKELFDLSNMKNNLKKFWPLLVSLLMTVSTTGYLSLMILILGIFLTSKTRMSLVKKLFLVIIASASVIVLYNAPAVQEKLAERKDQEENSSYGIRMLDNIGLLTTALESPISGYGMDTYTLVNRNIINGSITSSNGWLYGAAANGFPFLFFVLFVMYKNIVKKEHRISGIFILITIIVSQCNEPFMFFPYVYMFLYRFGKIRRVQFIHKIK